MDTETERQIQGAMDNLTHGRTTIAIAHRLSTLRRADRLVVLDRGRIAEVGTHADLLEAERGLCPPLSGPAGTGEAASDAVARTLP